MSGKENLSMGNTVIQTRNDTASNWTTNNPTLALGEIGLETDTKRMKVGDGSTAWNSLGYYGVGASFKYGLYTLSADQTSNLSVGDHVEWDTDEGSLGGLSTGSGQADGIVTLSAGITYKITGALQFDFSSAGQVKFQVYDGTNLIGKESRCISMNLNANASSSSSIFAIVKPETDADIEVRLTVSSNPSAINYDRSWLLIEEYGGY